MSQMPRKPVPIAVGLVWSGQRLATGVRPAGSPLAGYAEFPGGKVETGESGGQAVLRECREELGIEPRLIGLRLEVAHDYAHGSLVIQFFDCQVDDDCPPLRGSFVWRTIEEALALRFPPANDSILNSIKDRPGPLNGGN